MPVELKIWEETLPTVAFIDSSTAPFAKIVGILTILWGIGELSLAHSSHVSTPRLQPSDPARYIHQQPPPASGSVIFVVL